MLHSVRDEVSGPYVDGLESAGAPARCEPAGHVRAPVGDEMLVTTIHLARGEWDVVIVGSLNGPDLDTDRVGRNLAEHLDGCSGEPAERIADLDRARQHYGRRGLSDTPFVATITGYPVSIAVLLPLRR